MVCKNLILIVFLLNSHSFAIKIKNISTEVIQGESIDFESVHQAVKPTFIENITSKKVNKEEYVSENNSEKSFIPHTHESEKEPSQTQHGTEELHETEEHHFKVGNVTQELSKEIIIEEVIANQREENNLTQEYVAEEHYAEEQPLAEANHNKGVEDYTLIQDNESEQGDFFENITEAIAECFDNNIFDEGVLDIYDEVDQIQNDAHKEEENSVKVIEGYGVDHVLGDFRDISSITPVDEVTENIFVEDAIDNTNGDIGKIEEIIRDVIHNVDGNSTYIPEWLDEIPIQGADPSTWGPDIAFNDAEPSTSLSESSVFEWSDENHNEDLINEYQENFPTVKPIWIPEVERQYTTVCEEGKQIYPPREDIFSDTPEHIEEFDNQSPDQISENVTKSIQQFEDTTSDSEEAKALMGKVEGTKNNIEVVHILQEEHMSKEEQLAEEQTAEEDALTEEHVEEEKELHEEHKQELQEMIEEHQEQEQQLAEEHAAEEASSEITIDEIIENRAEEQELHEAHVEEQQELLAEHKTVEEELAEEHAEEEEQLSDEHNEELVDIIEEHAEEEEQMSEEYNEEEAASNGSILQAALEVNSLSSKFLIQE
jgi:hypothetical protein